jgi:O-antigen ligase
MTHALERAAALAFLLLAAALPWSIAPMSIAVVLCGALTLAVWWLPQGPRWYRTPIDYPALGWLVALVVAASLGEDPSGSWGRITKGFLLAIIPLAAYHARDPKLARRAIAMLLISAAIATIYALVKFEANGGAFPVRVRGAVGHPLTYGGQAMLLATVAGAILLRANDKRWKIAAAALLTLILPALLGSYTRSAWISTIVAWGVILAFTRARWLVALAVGVVAIVLVLPGGYRERALSAFQPHSVWNRERLLLWQSGWHIFQERPITGVGLQDLYPLIQKYRSPEAHEDHGHLHNVYLQIVTTMGVVGLAAFGWLATGLFRTAGKHLRRDLREGARGFGIALRIGAVAALVGFLVAGLFEWNFGDEELLDFLFVLVGIAFAASGWERAWDDVPRSS